MAPVRVLFVGEIVGKSGVWVAKELLAKIRQEHGSTLSLQTEKDATGGFGIGKNHAVYLHKLGIDVLTTGECSYYKKTSLSISTRRPTW